MPNHFHILAKEIIENGISTYMRKLLTAYSMYFNKKYKRTGKLYEGVFKSVHIDKDEYLKYIYSYIHLNPAKLINKNWKECNGNITKLLQYVFDYSYSSLKEYSLKNYKIITPSEFPNYFNNPIDHKKELFEWLNLKEE
jgi:putative transposase